MLNYEQPLRKPSAKPLPNKCLQAARRPLTDAAERERSRFGRLAVTGNVRPFGCQT